MNEKVLIVDAYTPAHVGNGVLLVCSIDVVKRAFPNAEIRFLSLEMTTPHLVTDAPYEEFLFRFPVNTGALTKLFWFLRNILFVIVQAINVYTFRFNPASLSFTNYRKKALDEIFKADIVVSITGESINDRTKRALPFYLFSYWLAAAWGKKMVIFPQSIGPLRRAWTRFITRLTLRKCTLVVGRDQFSIQELRSLDIPEEKVVYSPDVGVIQPRCAQEEARKILADQGIDIGSSELIGVSVSTPIEDGIAKINHIEIIVDALRESLAKRDAILLIMPANMPLKGVDEGDYNDCEAFRARLSEFRTYILQPRIYTPNEYKGILGLLSFFVTSRMHVSILSTMAVTPTITLNTQRKLRGFMTNIGQEAYSMDLDGLTSEQLVQKITEIRSNQEDIRGQLAVAAEEMNSRINEFAAYLKQKLSLASVS